jgi:hypothetical protein
MDRTGNGSASADGGNERSAESRSGDRRLTGALEATGARAADIAELSRRALSAEAHLLAYVVELEDEVRRLRRQLSDSERYRMVDGTG